MEDQWLSQPMNMFKLGIATMVVNIKPVETLTAEGNVYFLY
jgi:hypothetical protein